MKNYALKKLMAILLLITLVFGQLASGLSETMTEEEQAAYEEDIAAAEERMAQNIYINPHLGDTSGGFTTYTVDFYGSLTPLFTYWSLCNFNMQITDETKAKFPDIESTGGAYTGLQHITQDTKVGILSFWEHNFTNEDGETEVLRASRVYPEGSNNFDGEGEGTNCIKQYDWEGEHWYRLVLHCWEDVENETTFCGMWLCDLETGKWTLFSYFDTHFVNSYITGRMSMFQENFVKGISHWMNEREFFVKNIYVQDVEDGEWYSLDMALLTYGDLWGNKMGGASIGTGENEDGEYFFGRAGGLIEGQYPGNYVAAQDEYQKNLPYSAWFSIEQPDKPTLATPDIKDVTFDITDGVCSVGWSMSDTSSPELLYEIDVTDEEGNSIYSYKATRPEEYAHEFEALDEEFFTVTVKITDIYGQTDTMSITYELDTEVVAPEGVGNLVYTGEEQTLISAGSVVKGTKNAGFVIYSAEDGKWSSELPTGIDAGEYTVNYIAMDYNGNVLESGNVVANIEKARQSVPQNLVFNKETVNGKGDGTISGLTTAMEYSLDNGDTWTSVTDVNMLFSAGNVKVRNAETKNYKASGTVSGIIGTGGYLSLNDFGVNNAIVYGEDDLYSIVYGGEISFVIEPNLGYSFTDEFVVLANGVEILPDENGLFTITNITEDIYLEASGIEDVNPPVISGVVDGGEYYTSQFFKVEDDNLVSVIINGEFQFGSTEYIVNGNQERMYKVVAEDEGGNIVELSFKTKLISTLEIPLESVSDSNSYDDNCAIINDVLQNVQSIDLTYATASEKEEIQAIIDRCNELLSSIKTYTVSDSVFSKASYQAYLIEPWAMRTTVRFTDSEGTTIDVADMQDYGVYAIRAGMLDALEEGEVTINDIILDSDTIYYGMSDIEGEGMWATGDGRATFSFDDGLFTYRLSEEIYWVAYCKDAEGEEHYMAYKLKSLSSVAEALVSSSTTNSYIKDILEDMLVMEDAIIDYRSDFDNLTDLEPSNPSTVQNCGINFGLASTDGKYAIGNSYRVSLIEPWSIRLIARIYDTTDEDTSSTDHIDYSAADDYGVIVFQDIDGTHGNMTSYEDLLALDNAYVYSKSQGNMEIDPVDSNCVSAQYDQDIYTYLLDKNIYCVSFVEIDGQFYYSKVLTRNLLSYMEGQVEAGTASAKLLTVFEAMVEMYESVKAYHETL